MTTPPLALVGAPAATVPAGTMSEEIWRRLAAPLDASAIAWRQDGKVVQRDGRYLARFVPYVEAGTVRERLDQVVPGRWELELAQLPGDGVADGDGSPLFALKARLRVLGVTREDVGQGRDWKGAATDAFKRAAQRFGIGHELASFGANWVEMDGDGKYAKPREEPAQAYARRHGAASARWDTAAGRARRGRGGAQPNRDWLSAQLTTRGALTLEQATYVETVLRREGISDAELGKLVERIQREQREREEAAAGDVSAEATEATEARDADRAHRAAEQGEEGASCPVCGGPMWDNRTSKRGARAPDFKCRDATCEGVIWPAKGGRDSRGRRLAPADVPAASSAEELPLELAD